jgi:aminopeptidase N
MQKPTPTYLANYAPPEFLIESVDLYFDLIEEVTTVRSQLVIKRNGNHQKPLLLNGEELKLVKLAIDGQALGTAQYQLDKETLCIPSVPDTFTLSVENQITPHTNTRLMGLFKSGSLFCTQCEPQGFRRITYFIDRPDVLTRFTTTIAADKHLYPFLLSNGNSVERGELPNGRHWVQWVDPFKKPGYLFALVAGDLDCL